MLRRQLSKLENPCIKPSHTGTHGDTCHSEKSHSRLAHVTKQAIQLAISFQLPQQPPSVQTRQIDFSLSLEAALVEGCHHWLHGVKGCGSMEGLNPSFPCAVAVCTALLPDVAPLRAVICQSGSPRQGLQTHRTNRSKHGRYRTLAGVQGCDLITQSPGRN